MRSASLPFTGLGGLVPMMPPCQRAFGVGTYLWHQHRASFSEVQILAANVLDKQIKLNTITKFVKSVASMLDEQCRSSHGSLCFVFSPIKTF